MSLPGPEQAWPTGESEVLGLLFTDKVILCAQVNKGLLWREWLGIPFRCGAGQQELMHVPVRTPI